MLSTYDKGKIVILRERGNSYNEISSMLNIPVSVVKNWHITYIKTGKL